jgi:hypothetical protein
MPDAGRGLYRSRIHDLNAATAPVKLYVAIDQCVEGEVAPLSNPSARVEPVADLADENVSGPHLLAAESFHAAALRIGVASVSAGALSLFVCHEVTSSRAVFRTPVALRKGNTC